MNLFKIDPRLRKLANKAPKLIEHIAEYEEGIQRKIDSCEWVPDVSSLSCTDLCVYWKVRKKRREIWDTFAQYKE